LIEALKDKDSEVRWSAAEALRKIGTDQAMKAWLEFESDPTIEDLCKQLLHDDKSVRIDAAENLFKVIKPEHVKHLSQIEAGLKDQMWKVRRSCADCLSKIGNPAKESVKPLRKCLNDENADVRASAAKALGRIGPEAEEAVVRLAKRLKDESKDVRTACGLALEQIGSDLAKKALSRFNWE